MSTSDNGRTSVRCAQGITLDAGPEDRACVWNVVAYEGDFSGHPAGAFRFTRETFTQIVENFRRDPRFSARASLPPVESATPEQIACGGYDVVQWDFHHASEMPAASGNIAAAGTPAQGWVLDLKIGEHEGKCALLALSRFLEPARGYIRAGQYRWCSVSVWFGAPDPVTGKDQGAVLTSIAITNNPFLQGLPALRASLDALPGAVGAEFRAWVEQVNARLASLSATNPSLQAGGAGPTKENLMNQTASNAPNGAKDVPGALLISGGPDLRTSLARIVAKSRNCSIDDIGDHHILAAVENAAGLQAKIDELMGAIGAKTLAEALAKMSAADELKSKLSEALAGKAAAEDAMSGLEEDMVEQDVGMALASLGVTDESAKVKVRKALLAERGKTPETIVAFRKTYDLDALRKEARVKLEQAARQVVADRSGSAPAHLAASIATQRQTPAASPQGQPEAISATMGPDGVIRLGAPVSREPGPGTGSGPTLATLKSQYPHEPNDFARKVAFVKADHARNNPGAPALDHATACERAHLMRLVA